MIFTTWLFVFFFLAVYLLYLRLGKNSQNLLLLAASYAFYAFWDWRFISLLAFITLLNYYASHALRRYRSARARVWLLSSALTCNLGLLGVFKYYDFFAQSLAGLAASLGMAPPLGMLHIILPMGISFYTFQAMGYTIDVYRGQVEPCSRLRDYALYVAFFPQLVAGPIERASNLLTQVLRPRLLDWQCIRQGLWLLVQGFFLKAYVADNAAVLVNKVFASPHPTGAIALLGIYAFSLQIYGDFCGYSRIARGLARLMGFELMVNFRQPYFADSPSDFWRRWHISLSTWLRDYLYIPLGGNRNGRARLVVSLLATMFLGGLWHGAAWKFVIWGMYHGLLLVLFRFLPFWRTDGFWSSPPAKAMKILIVFHVICFGWLIFRCENLDQIVYYPWAILRNFAWDQRALHTLLGLLCLAIPVLALDAAAEAKAYFTTTIQRLRDRIGPLYICGKYIAYTTACGLMVGLLFLFGARGGKQFIYFQF